MDAWQHLSWLISGAAQERMSLSLLAGLVTLYEPPAAVLHMQP